ncbi:MAG: YhbY family RNA-binding protein [Pseudomonadota bacterium]|nr:YhbY family RNA-binding protein [Pseudomonadota bacterium]
MPITPTQRKQYRAIGHHLQPIVVVAENGISAGVRDELDRALHDHELIKVRLTAENRDHRQELLNSVLAATGAELVQRIGHVALILRRSPQPKPALSNLMRHAKN